MRYFRIMLLPLLLVAVVVSACSAPLAPAPSKITVSGGSFQRISVTQLKTMLDKKDFVFVNVHIPYAGEIANTDLFLPYDQVQQNLVKLPADKSAKIVLYCRSGNMSNIAATALAGLGYTNIWDVAGGMEAWTKAGNKLIQREPAP